MNLITTMLKALIKGKLGVGELSGLERFFLAQLTLPDRVPTMLPATNVEPFLIDEKYDYEVLTQNPEANLALYKILKSRFDFDVMLAPVWFGLLLTGAAEYGVKFQIEKYRVPYAVEHVIHNIEDVRRLAPLEEATGFFKVYLDTIREAQEQLSDTMISYVFDGPWDMAMLLRGDQHLPMDFRLHKDYQETDDPVRREKIRQKGDPDLWPAIMELTTRISIQNHRLAKAHGINMFGAMMADQFATKPVLGVDDFLTYVLPYIQQVWEALDKKVTIGYMVQSPEELEELCKHPVLKKAVGIGGYTNYIFPQTPEGVTLAEYDLPMLKLAKKNKANYMYMVHAKFIRDATKEQLAEVVIRICQMATEMRAGLTIMLGAVPPGTDFEKVDHLLYLVDKYGRY
ncbi:MAG: uroporphyrinogen decarboxylase family protein [Anaerolineales bacterium]